MVNDGVWACGSLIHLDLREFCGALYKLTEALKSGGIIFIALKENGDICMDQQRKTYYHEEEKVKEILTSELMLEEISVWSTAGKLNHGISNWTNYLYKK